MKTILRAEAKQAKLPRYFTGEPCRRGHIAERFVSTSKCVACNAAAAAKRRAANPQLANEKLKAWRASNPDKVAAHEARRDKEARKAAARARYAADPSKAIAQAKAWAKANTDRKKLAYRAWRLANLEKVKSALKSWRAANPDHVRAKGLFYRNTRRAAELQRTPAWADLSAIKVVYQDAAEYREAGLEVDVDHIIPLQGEFVSGLHVPENLRVCLSSVNRSKSNTYHVL